MIIHSYDVKHQDKYRVSFNRLATLVFGINFESWYQKGFWDDRYICHSFVMDGQVISNVSVSKMDLIINGQRKSAIQIGTVMTHPEFRSRGLSRQLMEYVMDTYENTCDFVFLFANRNVLDFYPKFGFRSVPEHRFLLESFVPSKDKVSLEKLNVRSAAHWKLIKQMLSTRRSISQRLGILNNEGLFLFYALHVFSECLHYSKIDHAIVVYEEKGETLHLYDVVSTKQMDMESLVSRIATKNTLKIQFHFTPDPFITQSLVEPFGKNEDTLFIKPFSELDQLSPFCFPKLAHA